MKVLRVVAVLFLCAVVSVVGQGDVPVEFSASSTNGQALASFLWSAEPGDFYEILTTTNLADGVWTNATLDPIPATNLIAQIELLSSNQAAFFQVRHLDTHGPEIVTRYPDAGAVGVSTQAVLVVELADPSGIDTNSIEFTVGGSNTFTLVDAGLSYSNNTVQFAPAESWGGFAETSTVVLACMDTLGNPFLSEWSFTLERNPVISSNAVLIGGGTQPLAMGMAAAASSSLTLIETAPDYLRFSYSGSHGLSVGTILVSDDADNIFYRRVLSLDESVPGEVKAFTEDVPLTALIEEGSFETSDFTMIEEGAQAMAVLGLTGSLDIEIPFSYVDIFSPPTIDFGSADLDIVASIDFSGGVTLNAEIDDWEMQVFNAEIDGSLEVDINAALEVLVPLAQINGELKLAETTVARAKGAIAGWPVWVDIVVGVYVCAEGSADAVFTFEQSAGFSANNSYKLKWTPDGWTKEQDGSFSVDPPSEPTLTAGIEGSASVYLRPEIAARVYSAAGVYADYRRGLKVEASWQVGDSQCVFELFDTASVNVGLDVVGVGSGSLPYINLWEEDKPMDIVWYWPENPLAAPTILSDPSDRTADPGDTVSFHASASGNPAPTYEWYRDGQLVASGSSISVTAGSYTTGDYKYKAINNRGTAWSAEATLSLDGGGSGVPSGMAYIPSGSFQMGDTFGEGNSDELPVHNVYVSGFYMDKYEVTNDEMVQVMQWAYDHGKLTVSSSTVRNAQGNQQELLDLDDADCRITWDGSDFGIKSAKGSGYPCVEVSWYGSVAYCNYRSEKEGRMLCYNLSDWNCDFSANGYRLPTEAEWEKAARGNLNGRRFGWGNTINHNYANYRANGSAYSYDTSPYTSYTYHPTYGTGGYPYSSPVGSFAPNGYGLYDMVGNLWEWCGDWYDGAYYATSPSANPRGASTGSYRVLRGGCWYGVGRNCRSASRGGISPSDTYPGIGFRSVLPAN